MQVAARHRLAVAALVAILAIPLVSAGPVLADAATHLQVSVTGSQAAGVGFTVTVTALDGTDAVDTSYAGTVAFSGGGTNATLPADYTFLPGDAGVRAFAGVVLTQAGSRTITVTDTANGSISGDVVVTVDPAGADSLDVTGFPSPTSAGAAHDVTITARDPFGNVATGYTGTVHVTSSDLAATLPLDRTFSGGDSGVATVSVTLSSAGTWSISATDTVTSSITGTQAGIVVDLLAQAIDFDPLGDATYGDPPFDVAATASSGLVVSFASLTSSACTLAGAIVTLVGAGTCTIRATQAGNGTYAAATPVDQGFDVDPATVTPQVTVADKVYDGTPGATILTRDLVGVLGGDDATLVGGTAAFASENVGTARTVTATGLTLGGADAGSYTLVSTSDTTSADITARTLTVSATGADRVYDGTTAASVSLGDDRVPGDVLTVEYADASFATPGVGTNKPVSVNGIAITGGSDAGNYTLGNTTASTTADITTRAITVTADAQSKVYGTADPELTYQVTSGSLANGDELTGTLARAAGEDVGPRAITRGSLTAGGNYALTFVGASLAITPAPLTITAVDKTRTYGSGNPALTVTYGGLTGGDTAPTTLATCSTTAVAGSDVGAYPIACSGAADPNYTIGYDDGTLSVTQKALTVTASSTPVTFGAAVPAITPSYAGFVLGDDAGDLDTPPSCSTAYAQGSGVGTYTTSCSGGSDLNYSYAFAGGLVTVGTKTLTVIGPSPAVVYGDAVPPLPPAITGFVLGDDAGDLDTAPTCSTAYTQGSSVGGYATTCAGGADINYAFTYQPGTLTVTPRAITVTADPKTKTYGDADPPLTHQVTAGSLHGSDAFAGALARAAGEGVGTRAITVGSLSAGGNYTLTFVGANLTITTRGLSVTANAKSRAYGAANPTLDATISGFAFGQNLASSGVTGSAACSTTATPASPVSGSPYAITCTQGTLIATNYHFATFGPGSLTVTVAATTTSVGSDDATSVFGQLVTFTATIGGSGGGTATGAVTFTIDGTPQAPVALSGGQAQLSTSALGVGAHTVAAAYSGDANLGASSGTLAGGQVVARAATTVLIETDDPTSVYGQEVTFTATIAPVAPGAGTPGGELELRVNGIPRPPVALAGGQATLSTSLLAAGTYEITVSYAGDASFGASFGTLAGGQAVAKATLTVTADAKSRPYGITNPPLTATLSGFANGEILATSGVTGAPGLATTATPASAVLGGPYPISVTLGTLAAANYDFSLVGGLLTVVPAPTTVILVSSVNPAVPGQPVVLTATLTGIPTPAGTIDFQRLDGAAWNTFESATLTTSFVAATDPITLPGSEGELHYRAVFTSPDPNFADDTGDLVQVIGKSAVTVTLAASRAKWESTVPVAFTATITPSATGVTVPITGSVDFTIDGGAAMKIQVVNGSAALPARLLPLGTHQVDAAYTGDGRFLAGTATPLSQAVEANVVAATGVAVSSSTIYPYKDTWRDTITIGGTRTEPLAVTIRIYKPTGALLSTRTFPTGTGTYASTWNGRYSSGTILPAGRYKVVQTLTDPSSTPALTRTWSYFVTLSTKRMVWTTVSIYRNANAPSAWSGPPSLLSSTRYKTGARLITRQPPGWAAFGYTFTLPSASTIKSVAFYVQGGPWSGPSAPKIGLHDWRTGSDWLKMYDATRARRSVGTSTSSWYGISGDPAIVVRSISGKRYVRGYVDTGGYVGDFSYDLGRVRVVVTYGVLR